MCFNNLFINKMNIIRVYVKFLPLHVGAVLPSIMKIYLNAPTHYIKLNTQEINSKTYFIFHNILNLKLCGNDVWTDLKTEVS
jgi:hypothetical protein